MALTMCLLIAKTTWNIKHIQVLKNLDLEVSKLKIKGCPQTIQLSKLDMHHINKIWKETRLKD